MDLGTVNSMCTKSTNALILTGKALQVRVFVLHNTFNPGTRRPVLYKSPGSRITSASSLQLHSLQAAPAMYKALPLSNSAARSFHMNIL